jgi:hypothetical protein
VRGASGESKGRPGLNVLATSSIPKGASLMRSKTMGMVLLCHLILVAFVGDDPDWHVFKLSVMLVLKLCCFRYI